MRMSLMVFCGLLLAPAIGIAEDGSMSKAELAAAQMRCKDALARSAAKACCLRRDTSITSQGECRLNLSCGSGNDRRQVTFVGTVDEVS